jgi:hypothetical protein
MLTHRRLSQFGVATLVLLSAWASLRATRADDAFTPFVARPLPQSARGDFDGDGRPDLAAIRQSPAGLQITVGLSGSSAVVDLSANVTGLLGEDVDHDGDVDLVAVSRAGEVLIWLNDGHGHFTRAPVPQSTNGLGDPTLTDPGNTEIEAVPVAAPLIAPAYRTSTLLATIRADLPDAPRAFTLSFLSTPTLRAPPAFV